MTKTGIVFRPVYVARARSGTESFEKLIKRQHVVNQMRAAHSFTTGAKISPKKAVIIRRTKAKFDLAIDKTFQNLVFESQNSGEVILVDDFIRLIDCRDLNLAAAQVDYLTKNVPTLMSITHGNTIKHIPATAVTAAIFAQAAENAYRSETIKKGLGDRAVQNGATKPTRKAINKGVAVKKKLADHKAQLVYPEIERIRLSIPTEQRENLKLVAEALNAAGIDTTSGRGQWQGISVKRVLERIERMDDAALK